MASTSIIHIAENTPEHVAYKMMRDVFLVEHKMFDDLSLVICIWTRSTNALRP